MPQKSKIKKLLMTFLNFKKSNLFLVGFIVLVISLLAFFVSSVKAAVLEPTLLTPADNYEYKICDVILFSWQPGGGSTGTYYFNAKRNGEYFTVVGVLTKDVPCPGTKLSIPWKIIETEAPDGIYEWWVCNGPDGKECSAHRTIIKDTKPILLKPNGQVVLPGDKFDWEPVPNAKNYVAKLTGNIGGHIYTPLYPAYWSFGGSWTDHTLTMVEYSMLWGIEHTWTVAATCDTWPTFNEMKKLSYANPFTFY